MPKVFLHNLTIPYTHANLGTFDFDQNALFFAESEDIVVTRNLPSRVYLSFLEDIGIKEAGVDIVNQQDYAPGPNFIFKDKTLAEKVRQKIKDRKASWLLDSFMLTRAEADWAKNLGIPYHGNPEHYFQFGTKSSFRVLAKKAKLPTPEGFGSLEHKVDGAIAAARLFLKGGGEMVIKQDEGVAGLSSKRIARKDFFSHPFSWHKFFPSESEWGVKPTHSSRFIVEKWHNDAVASPSTQAYIDENRKIKILSLHCQLMRENRMTYRGCLSHHWLSPETKNILESGTYAFGHALAEHGFRGHFALNCIILENGRTLWTELNPRRVSSSYPWQIAKRLEEKYKVPLSYKASRVQRSEWKEKNIEWLLSILDPFLFGRNGPRGVIPYDYGLLSSHGELTLFAADKDQGVVAELFEKAIEKHFK